MGEWLESGWRVVERRESGRERERAREQVWKSGRAGESGRVEEPESEIEEAESVRAGVRESERARD
jgi:hypothetical protein